MLDRLPPDYHYQLIPIVGSLVPFYVFWRLVNHDGIEAAIRRKGLRILYSILPLWLLNTYILGRIVVYFGIAKWLTFGIQIGKVLPSSCQASTEGYLGQPCSMHRLLEWGQRMLSGEGSFYEMESGWIKLALLTAICILWDPVIWIFLKAGLREDREYNDAEHQPREVAETKEE